MLVLIVVISGVDLPLEGRFLDGMTSPPSSTWCPAVNKAPVLVHASMHYTCIAIHI